MHSKLLLTRAAAHETIIIALHFSYIDMEFNVTEKLLNFVQTWWAMEAHIYSAGKGFVRWVYHREKFDFLETNRDAPSSLFSKRELGRRLWTNLAALCITKRLASVRCDLQKETLFNTSLQTKGVMNIVCRSQFHSLKSARAPPVCVETIGTENGEIL